MVIGERLTTVRRTISSSATKGNSMRHSSRHGFTLVELLVVISIIGVLVGLLLPAVQAAREAARRMECSTRMAELAKASMMFEQSKKRYPGTLEAFGKDASGNVKVGTWAVALLPHIEQEPLYDLWQDPSSTPFWTPNNIDFYPNLAMFQCASDALRDQTQALNSYVVNAGFYPFADTSVLPALNYPPDVSRHSQRPQNGIFSNRLPASVQVAGTAYPVAGAGGAACRADSIRDGLSQTIAFSENVTADQWGYVGNVANDEARLHHGMVWLYRLDASATVSPGRPPAGQVVQTNKINGNHKVQVPGAMDAARPSSFHSGVVNVSFADGHAGTLSDGIDYHVYQSLLTPQGKASDQPNVMYILKDDDFR
jgi:prepilin-type N-terminal cleavage/methylation domain-containing protein/prepilin-type processing-associated H-X9-DG protein